MRSLSVEKIRQVSNDGLFERILISEPHPSNPNLTPTCHLDLLEEHARNHHITGGQGAIRDWLETISLSKESSRDDGGGESVMRILFAFYVLRMFLHLDR